MTVANDDLNGVFAYANLHVRRTQRAAAVPVKGSVRAKSDVSTQGAEPAKAWKETRRCRLFSEGPTSVNFQPCGDRSIDPS